MNKKELKDKIETYGTMIVILSLVIIVMSIYISIQPEKEEYCGLYKYKAYTHKEDNWEDKKPRLQYHVKKSEFFIEDMKITIDYYKPIKESEATKRMFKLINLKKECKNE